MRVVVGTGGTAGHILPALATARALRDRGAEVVFVGRDSGQEKELIPSAGFPMETIRAEPLPRKPSLDLLRAPAVALRASRRCRPVIRGAGAVVAMGGYVSVPVSLAARAERVPLVVHEQNAVLGLANRVAARWARAVALSFAETAGRLPRRLAPVTTGNPVREEIRSLRTDRSELRETAVRALGLRPDRRTIVVFGGSQGALRLNEASLGAAGLMGDDAAFQMLLLTGARHHDAMVSRRRPGLPLHVLPYLDRMELAYAVADLVVCRAGATTVAEVTVAGLPSVMVPYPHATGRHQEANARALVRAGAAKAVPDDQITGERLAAEIAGLLDSPAELGSMGRASAAFGKPEAADALASLALSVGKVAA